MIGKLLGHSQIQTTARYAHLARDSVQASAARVAASIGADILSEDSFAPPALGELPLATRVRIAAQHDGAALPRDTVAASAARIAISIGTDILSEDSFAPPAPGELLHVTQTPAGRSPARVVARHESAALTRDAIAASAARIAASIGADILLEDPVPHAA